MAMSSERAKLKHNFSGTCNAAPNQVEIRIHVVVCEDIPKSGATRGFKLIVLFVKGKAMYFGYTEKKFELGVLHGDFQVS